MLTLGIFVGGKSRRMGGRPKGLLLAPDSGETLLERTAALAASLGLRAVLVGDAGRYQGFVPKLERVPDAPAGIGPLGGLSGLLQHVAGGPVLAVACDMPFLTCALLTRFVSEQLNAEVLAARRDSGLWEPLCARYQAERVTPLLQAAIADGVRSFQGLFARLAARELTLAEDEWTQLADWDAPSDLPR